MGAGRTAGASQTSCRRKSQAIETRADRSLPIASHRSQGAGRRIVGRAESRAGCRKNPARWIIGSDGGGNGTGEKGRADCQYPEPIQYHRPRLGGRAQLLRERKDGIHSVGADRRKWEPFVEQGRQFIGSRSEKSQ